jgi:hypothetical protein
MAGVLTAVMLGGMVIAQISAADAQSQAAAPRTASTSVGATVDLSALPPAPRGKSTILGGEVRSVDPVRDELMLKIYGQRQVKILFDERTQVYLDGKKIPLGDLSSTDHASVQTVLDGSDMYALSIHMLSRSPEGECQGRVINYDPGTRELTIDSLISREPIKLFVPANTSIARVGQPAFSLAHSESSDLLVGALISVKFESGKEGHGVASQISILATPGSAFTFVGNLSALDTHSGILVLVDPLNETSHQISFDSARIPASRNLHLGDRVMVTADFDGVRYTASAITAD